MSARALRIKQDKVPRQQGEKARLKVVRGPDFGAIYVLTADTVVVGRGDDSDVVISDVRSSRKHAELRSTPQGWNVKDLGSANGIVHNGNYVRQANLKNGDLLGVGETALEFQSSNANTQILLAPPKLNIPTAGSLGIQKSDEEKKEGSRKALLILGALGVVGYILLADNLDPSKIPESRTRREVKAGPKFSNRALEAYLPQNASNEVKETAEKFFKLGFREYREHNYLRAKAQFETALQIDPGHALSRLYVQNCVKAMKDEIQFRMRRAKKSFDVGQLREARGHYEAVMRLLANYSSDPSYIEAKTQLEIVRKKIKEGAN